jgi:hypothetical protein
MHRLTDAMPRVSYTNCDIRVERWNSRVRGSGRPYAMTDKCALIYKDADIARQQPADASGNNRGAAGSSVFYAVRQDAGTM